LTDKRDCKQHTKKIHRTSPERPNSLNNFIQDIKIAKITLLSQKYKSFIYKVLWRHYLGEADKIYIILQRNLLGITGANIL